jgi:hypothetical protein
MLHSQVDADRADGVDSRVAGRSVLTATSRRRWACSGVRSSCTAAHKGIGTTHRRLQVIGPDLTALAGVAGEQHSFTTFRLPGISSPPSDELE